MHRSPAGCRRSSGWRAAACGLWTLAVADGGRRLPFRRGMPAADWCSIESGLTGAGIPDLNGCVGGCEFWVECKACTRWAVTVRPMQVGWPLRRARAGGRTFFAVRRRAPAGPRRGDAVDELWLIRGSAAAELRDLGLRNNYPDILLGLWRGGPSTRDTAAVQAALTGRSHGA